LPQHAVLPVRSGHDHEAVSDQASRDPAASPPSRRCSASPGTLAYELGPHGIRVNSARPGDRDGDDRATRAAGPGRWQPLPVMPTLTATSTAGGPPSGV